MDAPRLRTAGIVLIVAFIFFITLTVLKLPLANVIWMKEGEIVHLLNDQGDNATITEVQMINVAGQGNRTKLCGFSVDGNQMWIEEGDDREMKGVRIYVRKVVLVRDQLQDKDYCKVTFTKPIIKLNQSVEPTETTEEELEVLDKEPADIIILPEEEMPKTVEEPTDISLWDRIISWFKNLF